MQYVATLTNRLKTRSRWPAPAELIYHFFTQEIIGEAGCCARRRDTIRPNSYRQEGGLTTGMQAYSIRRPENAETPAARSASSSTPRPSSTTSCTLSFGTPFQPACRISCSTGRAEHHAQCECSGWLHRRHAASRHLPKDGHGRVRTNNCRRRTFKKTTSWTRTGQAASSTVVNTDNLDDRSISSDRLGTVGAPIIPRLLIDQVAISGAGQQDRLRHLRQDFQRTGDCRIGLSSYRAEPVSAGFCFHLVKNLPRLGAVAGCRRRISCRVLRLSNIPIRAAAVLHARDYQRTGCRSARKPADFTDNKGTKSCEAGVSIPTTSLFRSRQTAE